MIDDLGVRAWMALDAVACFGVSKTMPAPFMMVITNEESMDGRIEFSEKLPNGSIPLFGTLINPLPPIDVVFAKGSERVGSWLADNGWGAGIRYNEAFPAEHIVEEYFKTWISEWPLYVNREAYAIVGGWHQPGPDDDWHALLDQQLLAWTLRDAEPWVEA
ncbi:MAG: hypothetical protein V4710_13590, partial [Verrucomicrobiota bacterium]